MRVTHRQLESYLNRSFLESEFQILPILSCPYLKVGKTPEIALFWVKCPVLASLLLKFQKWPHVFDCSASPSLRPVGLPLSRGRSFIPHCNASNSKSTSYGIYTLRWRLV